MRQQHPRIPNKKERDETEFGKPMSVKSSTEYNSQNNILEKIKENATSLFEKIMAPFQKGNA